MYNVNEVLPRNIKRLRLENEVNQKQLADKLGVALPTVSSWETGRRMPSLNDVVQLALALGVTPNDLLSFEGLQKEIVTQRKNDSLSISITDHEFQTRKGNTFTYAEIHSRKKNRPRYQIYISNGDGIKISGIDRHIIAFYVTKEAMQKELKAISNAISKGKNSYTVKYNCKVTYDLTGLPIVVEKEAN